MKKFSKRVLLVNIFGTFGYIFSLFAWAWVGILYLPGIMANDTVNDFLFPAGNQTSTYTPSSFESSPFMMIIALAVTVVILIATIVVLIKIPIAVARTGKTITTKAAESAIPLVTKNQPLPPAKKRLLTMNLIKVIKLLLVLLPFGLLLPGTFIELPLPYGIVILVGGILSLFSLLWFGLQYIFARLLKVDGGRLV